MYSLLNLALSTWLFSAVHNEPSALLLTLSNNLLVKVSQQVIVPEDKRILALRDDANDLVLQPYLQVTNEIGRAHV